MRRWLAVGGVGVAVGLTALVGTAFAIGTLPWNDPTHGDTLSCSSAAYSCTGGGYSASSASTSGWPWSNYGYPWATKNSYGPHNCTLYAAFRLAKNGLGFPGWSDNGGRWHTHSSSHPNTLPAVGSIAEWSAGHVAYVESVSYQGITISDDSASTDGSNGNKTTRQTITWGSTHWPNYFLHMRDKGPTWPGDPRGNIVGWRNSKGSITSWLVDSRGYRHWIPTTAIYSCLRSKGAKDYGPQPAAILDLLPDAGSSSWATCK